MIDRLKRMIQLAIGKCVVTALQKGNYQLELLAGETRDDIEYYQHFGFSSIAPVGSKGIVVCQNGIRENAVIIATKGEKKIELKEGETAIFNNGSAVIKILEDDTVEIVSKKITLNGDTKQFVTFAELDSALQAFVSTINTHTHIGNLGVPTAPPTIPMTLNIASAKTTTIATGG